MYSVLHGKVSLNFSPLLRGRPFDSEGGGGAGTFLK